jgi:hypothetical protein
MDTNQGSLIVFRPILYHHKVNFVNHKEDVSPLVTHFNVILYW